MTDHARKALILVTRYVANKGYDVEVIKESGDIVKVTKDGCSVAEIHYDGLMQVLNVTIANRQIRSLFLLHPTILLFLDGLFDPPPPVCDPDR